MAFLVAKITGTKPSMHAARITIEFGSHALLDIPDAWQLLAKGQRFPVQPADTSGSHADAPDPGRTKGASLSNSIAEAKRKLAESLGIASKKIEISIRL